MLEQSSSSFYGLENFTDYEFRETAGDSKYEVLLGSKTIVRAITEQT
jgi:hypothetical protein